MIQPITRERWLEAQVAEVAATTYDDPEKARESYAKIFRYLGMSFDQEGKHVVEVGCGAFPAASFCDRSIVTIIEPIEFKQLRRFVDHYPMPYFPVGVEDLHIIPKAEEVWLFNCLQHVRDPEEVIRRCKLMAPVIRFFEPVDYPTCVYHPHTFSQEDFERWFPGCVNRYTDRLENFFDADCVYGTWRAE